jgi:predicted PurR-regulated permease PerM
MKKITLSLLTLVMIVIMSPVQASEITRPVTTSALSTTDFETAEIKALIARVDEIKAMDKSSLSSSERKALRKEMRQMKRTVNHTHGSTVYVSGGLILLIVLVIILI